MADGRRTAKLEPGAEIPALTRHSRQVRPAPVRGRIWRLQPDPHRPRVREGGRPPAEHPARPLLDGAGRAGGHAGGRRRPALAEAPVRAVPGHGASRSRRSCVTGTVRERARRPRRGRHGGGAGRQPDRAQRRGGTRASVAPLGLSPSPAIQSGHADAIDSRCCCARSSRPTWSWASPWRRSGWPSATEVRWSPSTIRYELAALEEAGYPQPPAYLGRPGADRRRLPLLRRLAPARGPVAGSDRCPFRRSSCPTCAARWTPAMRFTTTTLSQMTDLLAAVSAPPAAHRDDQARRGAAAPAADRAGGRDHVERHRHEARLHVRGAGRRRPRRLGGQLPERAPRGHRPGRAHAAEQAAPPRSCRRSSADFLEAIAPVFSDLAETVEDTLYIDGTSRLLAGTG